MFDTEGIIVHKSDSHGESPLCAFLDIVDTSKETWAVTSLRAGLSCKPGASQQDRKPFTSISHGALIREPQRELVNLTNSNFV